MSGRPRAAKTAATAPPPPPQGDPASWEGCWYVTTTAYGEGSGAVPEGTHLLVVGVYEPGTPGTGAAEEPSPLVQILSRAVSGRLVPRMLHLPADVFRQIATAADEPDTWAEWQRQET